MDGFVDAVRAVRAGYTGHYRFAGAVDNYAAHDSPTKFIRIIPPDIDFANVEV